MDIINSSEKTWEQTYQEHKTAMCVKYGFSPEGVDILFAKYRYFIMQPCDWKCFLWGEFENFALGYLTANTIITENYNITPKEDSTVLT